MHSLETAQCSYLHLFLSQKENTTIYWSDTCFHEVLCTNQFITFSQHWWRISISNEHFGHLYKAINQPQVHICHLSLYFKTHRIILLCTCKREMSVHPPWYRKEKKMNWTLPRIKTPLVHPASSSFFVKKKKNNIQKYLTLPSPKQKEKKKQKQKRETKTQTCEVSCRKSIRLKDALKMIPFFKIKSNKV